MTASQQPVGAAGVPASWTTPAAAWRSKAHHDAQIQIWAPKEASYSFTDQVNWLVGQSRDFGKFQIPIMSNGLTWDMAPPPNHDFPPVLRGDKPGAVAAAVPRQKTRT